MAWNTQTQNIAGDNSSYLGVFDSIGDGSMIGGGASYLCNDTAMGFILDLPAIRPAVFVQATQVSFNFNAGGYPTYAATFPATVQSGNLLIAIFTSTFLSSLFDVAISDSTLLGWSHPFPTNGHVPGESNSLQVFLAIAVGGDPTVTITQTGFSNMTAGSLVLLEYSGPNGTISGNHSGFTIGGPNTLVLGDVSTGSGDLLFQAISIMPACPVPGVTPIGGGIVSSPPGPGNRIPPDTLPVISLPFCFKKQCRIFV